MDSARVRGSAQIIAIDKERYRLPMAGRAGHAPVNFEEVDVRSRLLELTGGRGPDKCIDEAERGFEIFKNKQDNCEKVVLKP